MHCRKPDTSSFTRRGREEDVEFSIQNVKFGLWSEAYNLETRAADGKVASARNYSLSADS